MRGLLILLRWPIRNWLHRRCLRRIARLERELGIGVPPANWQDSEFFEFKPGARWLVESTNHVQVWVRPNGDLMKKQWLEDGTAETTVLA